MIIFAATTLALSAWQAEDIYAQASSKTVVDTEEMRDKIDLLVERLDADQLATRTAAEKALVARGPSVLPLLPKDSDALPAGMRVALARVRKQLEQESVAQFAAAGRVTLQCEKRPLPEVLAEIEKQTGNKIVDIVSNGTHLVTLDCKATPFWEALDSVLDQTGRTVYIYKGGEVLLNRRSSSARERCGAASYNGVFRIEPINARATRDLRNPKNNGLRVGLEIAWEPRIAPISLTQPLDKITATDEQGNELTVDGVSVRLEAPEAADRIGLELSIPFALPENCVHKIATLKGELTATLPGPVETFSFDKLDTAENVQQSKGNTTVLLLSCRRVGQLLEIRTLVRFNKTGGALESHRGWIMATKGYLTAADGKRLAPVRRDTTRQGMKEVGFSWYFKGDDIERDTFQYETPSGVINIPIPYELKNIDLP